MYAALVGCAFEGGEGSVHVDRGWFTKGDAGDDKSIERALSGLEVVVRNEVDEGVC